jgi:hypothetical protein
MLAGRAIYIWKLKNVVGAGSVDDVVARAIRSKITSLWVKIGDGDSPFENTKGAVGKLLTQLVLKCKQSGISVLGFHVPICATEQSVSDEVGFVENAVRDFGLAGVVVDNEDGRGFFRGDARTAALYASGLRTAMTRANKLVVMSSNDIVSSHPKSYATIIGKAIDVNAPQVYYGQSRSVSARLNEAEKENKPIAAPFFPVGAAFLRNPKDNDGGFLDPKQCAEWAKDFIDLVSLLHRMSPSQFPGYGFWNWDEAPDEFWQALAETEVFSQRSPRHWIDPSFRPRKRCSSWRRTRPRRCCRFRLQRFRGTTVWSTNRRPAVRLSSNPASTTRSASATQDRFPKAARMIPANNASRI